MIQTALILLAVASFVSSVPFQKDKDVKCGIPAVKPDTSSNIVGGKESIPYSWPWQVVMFKGDEPWCGGTVISNQWIMTAAHCIEDREKPFTVKLGVFNKYKNDEPGEVVSVVSDIVPHPNFNFSASCCAPYDIALLKLEKPVEYTDHITPICLPNAEDKDAKAGTEAILTGWGLTRAFGEGSQQLRQVTLPVVSPEICEAASEQFEKDDMVCFGLKEGNKGACHGDSGGPAVYQKPGDNGRWTQIGITSWGTMFCSERGAMPYSMYAKVSAYLDFIKTHVKDV